MDRPFLDRARPSTPRAVRKDVARWEGNKRALPFLSVGAVQGACVLRQGLRTECGVIQHAEQVVGVERAGHAFAFGAALQGSLLAFHGRSLPGKKRGPTASRPHQATSPKPEDTPPSAATSRDRCVSPGLLGDSLGFRAAARIRLPSHTPSRERRCLSILFKLRLVQLPSTRGCLQLAPQGTSTPNHPTMPTHLRCYAAPQLRAILPFQGERQITSAQLDRHYRHVLP